MKLFQIDQRAAPYKIHARYSVVHMGDWPRKAPGVMVSMSMSCLFQRIGAGSYEYLLSRPGIEVARVVHPAVVG